MVAAVNEALRAIVESLRGVGFEVRVEERFYYSYLHVNGVQFRCSAGRSGRSRTMYIGGEYFTRQPRRAFDVAPMVAHILATLANVGKRKDAEGRRAEVQEWLDITMKHVTRSDMKAKVNEFAEAEITVRFRDLSAIAPFLDFVQELKNEDQ